MPDVAGAVFAGDLGRNGHAEFGREHAGDVRDGDRLAGTHVQCHAVGLFAVHGQQVRLDDVVNAYEIALLTTVFEYQRCAAIEQTRGEDSRYAGIRIGKRLAWTVDIEVTHRHDRQPIRAAEQQNHLFLVLFGERVDGAALQRLGFVSWNGQQLAPAVGTQRLPLFLQELLLRTNRRRHLTALGADVATLAIDRHRRSDNQLVELELGIEEHLQEVRGTLGIHRHVMSDFVHRLAHTHGGSQVENDIHIADGIAQALDIPHVATDELNVAGKVIGATAGVNLRREAVVHANRIAPMQQGVDNMRSDETSAS